MKDNKHLNVVVTQWRVSFSHHIISYRYHPLIMTLFIQGSNLKLIRVCYKRYQALILCGFPFILINHLVVHLSNMKWYQVHQINFTILKIFNFWIDRCPSNMPVSESLMNLHSFFFKYLHWWIHLSIFWLVRRPPIMLKNVVDVIFFTAPSTLLLFLVNSTASYAPAPFSSAF